jgi:hypothetical protein
MKREPQIASAVVACIELVQSLERGKVVWTVIVSRPGRDGTFSRNWQNSAGQLSADQAEDLESHVMTTAHNALLAWHGIQGVLPMG